MDTPSTSTDRKPTRRWPLAAAAGLLTAGLVIFVAFEVVTRPDANERATDLARRMMVTPDAEEFEAAIFPRFEQETGCHVVVYLPFFGPTLDNVARQATGYIHRLREASRDTLTAATGIGLGQAAGKTKTTRSDSVRDEYRYTAIVTMVDCKAPYLDAGY